MYQIGETPPLNLKIDPKAFAESLRKSREFPEQFKRELNQLIERS
jgi:hypothetical protein